MCRNHHDLLEMAVIESLPLRQTFRSSVIESGYPTTARAVLLALRAKWQAHLGEPNDSHLHVRPGRRTLEGVPAAPRRGSPTQTITSRAEVLRGEDTSLVRPEF